MENLELVKLTPDKVKFFFSAVHMDYRCFSTIYHFTRLFQTKTDNSRVVGSSDISVMVTFTKTKIF